MNTIKKLLKHTHIFILALTFAGLTGCGDDGFRFIHNLELETYEDDGDYFYKSLMDVSIGKLKLPEYDLPFSNPWGDERFGRIASTYLGDGINELLLDVNLTKVGGDNVTELPNGKSLPFETYGRPVIQLKVPVYGIKGYLSFGDDFSLFGSAVPIKELDAVGAIIGKKAYFKPFKMPGGVIANAGVFTSKTPGKSGVGLFLDVSSLLNRDPLYQEWMSFANLPKSSIWARNPKMKRVLPSHDDRELIEDTLYNFADQGIQLHLPN